MNVLIVHPDKGFHGGAEEVIAQLIKYLEDRSHEVLFVHEKKPFGLWKDTQTLVDWADVINVHNFPATLATFPRRQKPIVWMCNEPPELFTNWKRKPIEAINRWWTRKSGMGVIVADEMNAFRFYGIYGISPATIPYGVDYKFWSHKEAFYIRDQNFSILHVGNVSPYKNQLKSICQLGELLDKGIDATLTLAGGIGDEAYYHQLISDYIPTCEEEQPGFTQRVRFLGQVTQERIRDLYHQHDVLTHPVLGQGGWLVPFEAMCAGLPTITSLKFPAASLIANNELGVVTEDFISGVEKVRVDRDKITTHAKKWVRDNLTWEKFGERMVEVFEAVRTK